MRSDEVFVSWAKWRRMLVNKEIPGIGLCDWSRSGPQEQEIDKKRHLVLIVNDIDQHVKKSL